MQRRSWILALFLAACSSPRADPVFPATAAGGWRLKNSRAFPAADAPEMVRKIGTRKWWSAVYEGPGSATIDVYELKAPPGGLEMVQQWRPAADTVVWYTPRYFIVAKWRSPDRAAVAALIRDLQKQFVEEK